MTGNRITNQLIGLTVSLVVLVATVSVCSHFSIALAEKSAYEEAHVLASLNKVARYIEQSPMQDAGDIIKDIYLPSQGSVASIPKDNFRLFEDDVKVTSVDGSAAVQTRDDIIPIGVDRIDAEAVHYYNRGAGVKVAVLDTGIDLDHSDLNVAGNVSFVPGTTTGDDDNGHGTLVAGIIASLDNEFGTIGVAPEVELYSVKVLDKDGIGSIKALVKGIEWSIDNNMRVINMSLYWSTTISSSIKRALKDANDAGIVIVACAGNTGNPEGLGNNLSTFSQYSPVITVGAIDESDIRCSSSSTGDNLDLVAPGSNIYSTAKGGGYDNISYTSAASPHVAGVAALLIASGITSSAEVRQILQETAEDLGSPDWDTSYGYGLVNAARALASTS